MADISESIRERAQELGRVIGQSEEYKAVQRARERINEDREMVQRLNASAAKALHAPAIREKLGPQGLEVVAHSVAEFERQYRGDYEKFGKLIKELQIKLN